MSGNDIRLISRIRSKKLTYLTDQKLESLITTYRKIEETNLPGVVIEVGCALGGSAIVLATLKKAERPLLIYDVFGMIPPPTIQDPPEVHERYDTIFSGQSTGIGGDKYYGYEENLYKIVQANLSDFGICCKDQSVLLVKGLIQDTLTVDQPVAFAHIDVDWYDPVKTSLKRLFPKLVSGGSIILDDYHDWGGCKKAVDEYLGGLSGCFVSDDSAGSIKITKVDG